MNIRQKFCIIVDCKREVQYVKKTLVIKGKRRLGKG